MKISLLFFFSVICVFSALTQSHVFYGNAHSERSSTEELTQVFLDKNGDFYPALEISQSDFSPDHSIKEWFSKMTSQGGSAEFNSLTGNTKSYEEFQSSVIERILKSMTFQLDRNEKKVVVLIHGFRKPYTSVNGDVSSQEEYKFTKQRLRKLNPQTNYHFIEVYWDGMYMAPDRSMKFALRLGKLFKKEARANAKSTGVGLRRFLSRLPIQEFDIICHSLGAEVTTNLLFNDEVKSSIATPKQTMINVFFIGPAISKRHFKNYLARGSEAQPAEEQDNYRLHILFNHEDIVLSKSGRILGIRIEFSRLYGNTRLGCNCKKDAFELQKRFEKKFPNSMLKLYNAESIGRSHRFKSYVKSPEFADMMRSLQ